jgi:putative mycofactocin binding protein MftB
MSSPTVGLAAPVVINLGRVELDEAWSLSPSVALRPEPFGALAYHFGNRKLSFLKSKTLVTVVESLVDHPTAAATLTACGVTDSQRPAYLKALADLARSQMIEIRETP